MLSDFKKIINFIQQFIQQARYDSREQPLTSATQEEGGGMNRESKTEFSFYSPEGLSELHQRNPDLFAELAEDAIRQACMGRTPEQTLKRQQMQWIIDGQLRKAKTPLGRMHIMEHIFYSQVYGKDGQLARLMSGCTEFIHRVRGNSLSGPDKEVHQEEPLQRER
jgi:hypothetical protein